MKAFVRFAVLATLGAFAASACTVHNQEPPPLAGPSGLALTLRVTATPDSVLIDGGSQSAILVEAIDAAGSPRSGLAVRLDIAVGGTAQDCGSLSARNVVTGNDGKARAVFTAPPYPLPRPMCDGFTPGGAVTIFATPTTSNFTTVLPETAQIRMVPPGVIVPPPDTPTPKFSNSPVSPVANSPVNFDASASCGGPISSTGACTSASAITAYVWDFGDGTPASGGVRTSHTFRQSGTFNVTLTVTNDRGVSASTSVALQVGASSLPTASFTFSPGAPIVGDSVLFSAAASTAGQGHTLVSYRWTFGDGASATGASATHAFTALGTYTVQLTVVDEVGQQATAEKTVTIGSAVAPVAGFTFSPTLPGIGQPVVFDASLSKAATGSTIVDYSWNFGDNTGIQHSSGSTIVHHYATAGTYAVTLVVTDNRGATATATVNVVISSNPGGLFATFTFSPTDPKPGTTVFFNASASTGNIVDYAWDFGDGGTASGSSPTQSHPYGVAGTYIVRLTIRDTVGLTQTTTQSVAVK